MSLFKKMLSVLIASTLVLTPTFSNVVTAAIPAYIEIISDNFEIIRETMEGYDSTTKKGTGGLWDDYAVSMVSHVNDSDTWRVSGVTIADLTSQSISVAPGQSYTFNVPEDIARVTHFFTNMNINGTNLGSIDIEISTPVSINADSSPWNSETIYQMRTSSFAVGSGDALSTNDYKNWQIKISVPSTSANTATITKFLFYEADGIQTTYDTREWGTLGEGKPTLSVGVTVDATKRLSIEGITQYEEEKFKTLYAAPTTHNDAVTAANYFVEKGFTPGRQIFKFGPALEYVFNATVPDNAMKESAAKPNYADYSYLDSTYTRSTSEITSFDSLYDSNLDYVLCYNDWPSWNWRDSATSTSNGSGTPAYKYFDAAADLAAQYTMYNDQKLGGRGPKWIEVKNESTISNEWSYHSTAINSDDGWNGETYGSWNVLAEFHNQVAKAIKEVNPDVLVGGPTAAWMALDNSNFSEATNHLTFLNETAEELDFYSYHFYEGTDLIVNDDEGDNNTGYLAGRLEADLDLLRTHMDITNNTKPIIISETGTLHSGPSDPDFFIMLKNFNSYKIRYMNRANEFDKVVPFLLPATWWSTDSDNSLYSYDSSGKLSDRTKMEYYTEAWSEYNGKLVPVFADNDKVYTHSAQDGNIIYVAVNNLNPNQINVDLDVLIGDANITKVERNRTYLDQGVLTYEEFGDKTYTGSNLSNIHMYVEETSIFKITLDKIPTLTDTLYKETFYAKDTLKDTGSTATFTIDETKTENLESSVLRVSFGKDGGFAADMTGSINGYSFSKDLEYTNKAGRFFGYVDFEVPANYIKESNSITVDIPESGGKISTAVLINHYNEDAPIENRVNVSTDKISINGTTSDIETYIMCGSIYVQLDDFANLMNKRNTSWFELEWNEGLDALNIVSSSRYTGTVRNPDSSGGSVRFVTPNKEELYFNGDKVTSVPSYVLQEQNIYRIGSVCELLDIAVSWNESTRTIEIDTTKSFGN